MFGRIAINIETADREKAALDAVCKKILANKSILAWILKTCVEEYENCSLKEIEEEANEMFDYGDYVEEMGRQEGRREGRREGRQEGLREGENLLATLLNMLFADGRTEDAKLALINKEERNKFYREYGLTPSVI